MTFELVQKIVATIIRTVENPSLIIDGEIIV